LQLKPRRKRETAGLRTRPYERSPMYIGVGTILLIILIILLIAFVF
jgi:hypothetical protein